MSLSLSLPLSFDLLLSRMRHLVLIEYLYVLAAGLIKKKGGFKRKSSHLEAFLAQAPECLWDILTLY